MNVNVGTTETEVDTSAYLDVDARGQALILQNLGPGDIYFDFFPGVTAETGIKVATGGGYEVSDWGSSMTVYVVASEADTDLRYAVSG